MFLSSEEVLLDDVIYILKNPWEITRYEFQLEQSERFEIAVEFITDYLEKSAKDGFSKIWKTMEGRPIAVLGFYRLDTINYRTFFIGSKYMDQHSLGITRAIQKTIHEKSEEYANCTCGLYSSSNHPKQIKWFAFLGFHYVPEENVGTMRFFAYQP